MDGMETVEDSWVEERCPRKDFSSFSMCFYSFLCWLLLLIRMMAWIGRWMSLWFLLYLSNATRCLLSLSCLFSFLGIFFSVWKSRDTSHNHALSSTHTHTHEKGLQLRRSWWPRLCCLSSARVSSSFLEFFSFHDESYRLSRHFVSTKSRGRRRKRKSNTKNAQHITCQNSTCHKRGWDQSVQCPTFCWIFFYPLVDVSFLGFPVGWGQRKRIEAYHRHFSRPRTWGKNGTVYRPCATV